MEERRRQEKEEQIRREEEKRQWQEEEERRRNREEEEVKERYKMVSCSHSSLALKLLRCLGHWHDGDTGTAIA